MMVQREKTSFETTAVEFGRGLTREVAPEELPFYDELVSASMKKTRAAKDRVLGFGLEIDDAVSGALFYIGKIIMEFVWEHAKDSIGVLISKLSADAMTATVRQIELWAGGGIKGRAPVILTEDSL